MVGPWGHAETVLLPEGATAKPQEPIKEMLDWFDRYLGARNGGAPEAPVRVYVMGANVWRDEQEWPLARARETAWYRRGDASVRGRR